jgi:hypothetical protein
VLALDFAIGGTSGLAGAILPRGTLANLLGQAPPLGLDQRSSTAILVASAVALAVAAALRSGE